MKCVVASLVILTAGLAFAQEPGSKLYIPPPTANQTLTDGTKVVTTEGAPFNQVLQAEIFKERLPFKIVNDSTQADYMVQWSAIPEEGTDHATLSRSVTRKELYTVTASLVGKDSAVVWAGSSDKKNLHDSAIEITRQLKDTMKHKK